MIADGRVTILDTSHGAQKELIGNLGAISLAVMSRGERYIAIAGSEGVRVWDPARGQVVAAPAWQGHVVGLIFGPSEEWLAISGDHHITDFLCRRLIR